MLQDIVTVIGKEFKEILHMRGSKRGGMLNLVIVIGLMGIYMPLMTGREWVTTAVGPISFGWLPLFLVVGVVADSFAGERERHTLETLLASRLPDHAILFGKIGAAVLYCMAISISSLLLGGIVVNLGSLDQGFVFYSPEIFGGMVLFSFLLALLMASIGALVSLRASTVRQATQTLSVSMLVLWVGIFLATRLVPEGARASLIAALETASLPTLAAIAAGVLLVLDVVLIGAAMARFQRAKLILD
jgi:ABC-2 type transport system permease protein